MIPVYTDRMKPSSGNLCPPRINRAAIVVAGFTLVELSIVLVIIGLLVGGVLVGRDLINAAGIRAQISQFEKYNTAANTFKIKYGYLPGDIKEPDASSSGFSARGAYTGEGDGDGMIMGIFANAASSADGNHNLSGEAGLFWRDLSTANLIDNSFVTATATAIPNFSTTSTLSLYLPQTKLNGQAYLYVNGAKGSNYLGMTGIKNVLNGSIDYFITPNTPAFTVEQAYAIDTKIDDGAPGSGSVVTALYRYSAIAQNNYLWSYLYSSSSYPLNLGWGLPPAAGGCFDNGNVANGPIQYSMSFPSYTACDLLVKLR